MYTLYVDQFNIVCKIQWKMEKVVQNAKKCYLGCSARQVLRQEVIGEFSSQLLAERDLPQVLAQKEKEERPSTLELP